MRCACMACLQVWEQQLQQTQKAWRALHSKLAGVIAAAQQQQKQQAFEQEQAASSPIGVRGLAASRAQGRQVGLWRMWSTSWCLLQTTLVDHACEHGACTEGV
jgi:hypothetical protein